MRPIKLSVSAFCSYVDEQTIDFEKLGKSGVYLITGDTGAGKTTIFDAITFALYGDTSGDTRTSGMLRSKMADEKRETFVELLFEHGGKKYNVKRRYKIVKRKNGSYESETTPEAALTFDDGRQPITKSTEVTKSINEIIGIGREQFVRIAMIAQGEFSKILIAKTADECRERKQILRRLFGTQIYDNFKTELDNEVKRLKGEKKNSRIILQQEIKNISCDDGSSLSDKISKIDECPELDAPVIKVIVEELTELISDDSIKEKEYEKRGQSADTEVRQLAEQVQNAKKSEESQKDIESLENELKERIQQKLKLNDEEKKSAENKYEIERFKAEKARLEAEIGRYSDLDKIENESSLTDVKLKELISEIEKVENEISAAEKELEESKSKISEIGNAELRISELEKSRTENEIIKKEYSDLNDQLRKFDSKTKELENAQKKLLEAQNLADNLNKEAAEMRRRFNLEQAGIMAENLADGECCPVCGSTVHPCKAVKAENAPTQADVEKSEHSANKAQETAAKESGKCQGIIGELKIVEEKLAEDEQRLADDCPREKLSEYSDKKIEESAKELELIEKRLLIEKKAAEQKKKIESNLPAIESRVTEKRNALGEKRSEKLRLETKHGELSKQIVAMKSGLTYSSRQQAEETLDNYSNTIIELQKQIDNHAQNLDKCNSDINRISGSLETLKESVKKLNVTDTAENLNQKYLDKEKERKTIIEKKSSLTNRIAVNEERMKKILSCSAQYNKLCNKETWLTNLYNVTAGKISGKRTDLETYILIAYFDRVIGKANVHMMNMTSNKFELVQRMKNDEAGELKLDVRNTYDNVTYGVDSLSGGEKFIASLSLALGLSEVVQENAGGIKLDTMFVDEGFGSLSDNVLRLAINTLSSLGDGNRLIGIISHVPTLNEAIDKKIVVKKTEKSGSKAEIVC